MNGYIQLLQQGSIDQVTAVLSGKRIFAPPKNIAEVQNAYEIYENMDNIFFV